jgi:RNA polymerase sigma factor (sigma-70 family)
MEEVRSHGHEPVQSERAEAPQKIPYRVEVVDDVDGTLRRWNREIESVARAIAHGHGGSLDDAEDFAQAARISLARAARDRRPAAEPYRRKLIKHAAMSAARKERTRFRGLSNNRADLEDNLEVRRIGSAEAEVVDWITTLPSRLKGVYELLYERGYTQREAAEMLHVSQPRVAQLHNELIRRGREELLAA